MEKLQRVYIVSSLVQENYLVFGTMEKAQERIKRCTKHDKVFDKSKKEDLYITTRVVF